MNPIIQSLLDVDLYKFTMLQFIWRRYRDINVRFGFTNRTKQVRLANFVDEQELRSELDNALLLRISENDIAYLESIKADGKLIFTDKEFLADFRRLRLPPYQLSVADGQFKLEFSGRWPEVTLWETIALSIVNELYYRHFVRQMDTELCESFYAEGLRRINDKLYVVGLNSGLRIVEFGTRRRHSRKWQDRMVGKLVEYHLPEQFLGTSNVFLARKYGLPCKGTMAHELFMVLAAHAYVNHVNLPEAVRASHDQVLREWWDEYDAPLSIALTDTFGTDFAFQTMTEAQAHKWKGLRQDSGSPLEFADKALAFYHSRAVDASGKLLFFSDGLTVDKMIAIHNHVNGRAQTAFGWGTNLTNDLGLAPLSLVVKAIEASGAPTVKLSDNLAKATGPETAVGWYKQVFAHTSRFREACTY